MPDFYRPYLHIFCCSEIYFIRVNYDKTISKISKTWAIKASFITPYQLIKSNICIKI